MLNIQGKAGLPTAGTPAQPTYNPNIQQPVQQPVFMNPQDIMESIQQTVPVTGGMDTGVGALVAPTSTQGVGVPEQPQTLTPEQIFASQAEYNASTERQFATPDVAPSFVNPNGQSSSGVLQESLEAITANIAAPENKLGKITWDQDDAASLINFGETQTARFNDPNSAWATQLGGAVELNDESRRTVEPILTVAGANLLSGISSRKFENTMTNTDSDGVDYYTRAIGEDGTSTKDMITDPVKEVFEAGEPMLNQMVSSVTDDMVKLSATPNVTPTPESIQSSRDQAMTFIKDLTDQGQIKWARSKKGKVIPLLGDTPAVNMESASKLAQLYDVSSRGSVVTSLKAPKFPAMNASVLDTAVKKVFMDKRGSVKSTNAAEAFIQLQGSIPIGVNPVLYSIQEKMFKTVMDREDPVFNSTLSELDDVYKEGLVKKHGQNKAESIVNQKYQQLEKEMNDINVRAEERVPSYLINKQSPATLRYFHISNNLSIMGQKGTTRASFSFNGTQPVRIDSNSGLWSQGSPRAVQVATRIYSGASGKGIDRGQTIQRSLHNLKSNNPSEFQAINMYYNLGAQMAKHIDPDSAKIFSRDKLNNKPISKWAPLDYITFGTTMLGKASILGKELVDANNNNTLSEFAKNNSWMTEKGEWQYPSSVLIDAYQISIAPQGEHVRLQNMMEADARQSNAGLISIIVGDTSSASILGLLPQMLDTNAELHPGLREKIWSTVDEDVKATFTSVDDGPYKAAWGKLLSSLQEARGSRAAKDYGRGLVVAGLYGKTAQKMYSEAEDFFDKVNRAAVSSPVLNEAWSELRATYAGDNLRMLNDMTDLYTYSMEKHMSKLNGYQVTMRALGTAMAAINAPSTITNMLGGVQELSAGNISPELEQSVNDQVVDGLNIKTDKIAGMNIPRFTVQRDYAGAADVRLDGDQAVEYRPGTKQRNAWPVDVIQGGDSTIMTLAVLAMNSPDGGFKGNPVQAVAIHDALITGPEGHLLATNAYNNIAIPAYAKQAPNMMTKVVEGYNDRLMYIKMKHGDEGANIGTRFLGEESNDNSFHGLTGYFDKMYDNVYGAASQMEVTSPDLAVNNNQATTFLEPYQLARSKAKRDTTIRSNLRNKAILEAAAAHGWLPPTEANVKAREFNKVEGKDFVALVDIMRASSGLLNRGERLHTSLGKAFGKLPVDARPSLNSLARHNIRYGKGATMENSGLLERMTTQSSIGNNVIKSLTEANNEITHMVPA
jgi:hypothetical protein